MTVKNPFQAFWKKWDNVFKPDLINSSPMWQEMKKELAMLCGREAKKADREGQAKEYATQRVHIEAARKEAQRALEFAKTEYERGRKEGVKSFEAHQTDLIKRADWFTVEIEKAREEERQKAIKECIVFLETECRKGNTYCINYENFKARFLKEAKP